MGIPCADRYLLAVDGICDLERMVDETMKLQTQLYICFGAIGVSIGIFLVLITLAVMG